MTSAIASPLAVAGIVVGAASLLSNIVWNCHNCGWDLDRVPWYQAVLVAAVPFGVSPLGIIAMGVRAGIVRSRRARIQFAVVTLGLALPWLYLAAALVLMTI
jgi:hypothetical protein